MAQGTVEVRVTDSPLRGVFKLVITIKDIEAHRAEDGRWLSLVPGEKQFDLMRVSGIEQVVGKRALEAGRYTQIRLEVVNASVTIGDRTIAVNIPGREIKLVGSFEVQPNRITAVTLDFDAEKSLTVTGRAEAILKPVVKL